MTGPVLGAKDRDEFSPLPPPQDSLVGGGGCVKGRWVATVITVIPECHLLAGRKGQSNLRAHNYYSQEKEGGRRLETLQRQRLAQPRPGW